MNKTLLTTIAALTAVMSATAVAQTERLPAPVIGIVDTDAILRDSLASKGVRLERDKFATQYQTQVQDDEKKLRAEDEELAKQRGVMSPEVFQTRATDFQKKLADFQTRVRDKQERLDYSFQQSMQEIGQSIYAVAGEVAKERGINTVLARSQILLVVDPGMDITVPVLTKLNARLPSVKFQDPATLTRVDDAGNPVGGAPGAAKPAVPTAPAAKKP
jgi:Skp family chaperone for outer membrane proteins